MAKIAASEENVRTHVEARRPRLRIREAFAADDVTPYVFMGRAYLVGFLDDATDASRLTSLARAIDGVRSVDVPAATDAGRRREPGRVP